MKETDNNRTTVQNQAAVPPEAGGESVVTEVPNATVSPRVSGKSRKKKSRWEWNLRLLFVTVGILLLVSALSAASYFYHSAQTVTTLLERADAAEMEQDYAEQSRWLARYTLLRPDDLDAVVRMALAADAAADVAEPAQFAAAFDNARRQLGGAIARVGDDHSEVAQLRRRLIKRLLQLRGDSNREAEKQVLLLGAPRDDVAATRWLALALHGQLRAGTYRKRSEEAVKEDDDYWNWLANQKVGDVLVRALEQDKSDVELLATFLDTYVNDPDQFERAEDQAQRAAPADQQLEQVLAHLRSSSDSRSKLVLYQFELTQGNKSGATELLREAAAAASKRLADRKLIEDPEPTTAYSFPPYYWDYLVVVEGTRGFADENPDQVQRWYDQLMSAVLPGIPRPTVERVYLDAGVFTLAGGDQEKAIEIWQRGLDSINPNSLELTESVATVRSQDGSDEAFIDSLGRFRDAIGIASFELSQAGANISNAARTARGRQIERSGWKLGVLDSLVAVRDGRRRDGLNLLVAALSSTTDVASRDRIAVARQLASLYGAEGSWDKAAQTLERATDLAPDDPQLRLLAADAWRRAGNRRQAIEQRRAAGSAALLVDQIAGAKEVFRDQLRLLPEQRDLSEVRASIKRIRNRLSAAADNNQAGAFAGRLEMLEISLPPSGVSAEEHLSSPQMADAIVTLAERYVDDQDVQTFAAERLAVLGRDAESKAALQRLSSIIEESDSSFAIVKARMTAANGDSLAAAQLLIDQASDDPTNAERLLNLAASFAARGNDPELAYEAFEKIPEDRRSLSTLFQLSIFAKILPDESAILLRDGAKTTPLDLAKQWEDRLRKVEGDQGTYWRCLQAIRLIDDLRSDPNRVEQDDSRLAQGNRLVRQILAIRPSWGIALSLQGWLSAIAGKRQQAVDQLRAGLAAGDIRVETRRLLWEQLSLLNRWPEADEEIRRGALASGNVDRYGALRIEVALRQRDFERSLQIAESGIEERPDDFLSYLVLCNTARLAAVGSPSPEERSDLLDRAAWAIDQASELATQSEPSIYSAQLQLALARGDESQVSAEITRVQQSDLSEPIRLRLIAQTRLAQRDYGAAAESLEQAKEIDPSSQALVELAEVYRRLRRSDDEISALRLARKSRPSDAALANRLARAIATRDGKDVDWNEIADLLSTSGAASSNRLLYAILLAAGGVQSRQGGQESMFQGSDQQQAKAIAIFRQLIEEDNSRGDDAARVLALLLQDQAKKISESEAGPREELFDEVRSIYESLLEGPSPQIADLFRYAVFLLEFGEDQDAKIDQLQRQLESTSGGMVTSLDLGLRIATRNNDLAAAPEVVQEWVEKAKSDGTMTDDRVASIAGESLLRLGLTDEGLKWLDRAYRANPDTLRNYTSVLVNNGKAEKSVDVCASHFDENGDAESASLLVESLIAVGQPTTSSQHQTMIKTALAKYDKNAPLIEGVATLLMNQQSYDRAAALYQQTLRIDPRRVRALNNLAMVLSEIPGRQSEAIPLIERAVKLAGAFPELLDTKGVVLLRAGRLDEAKATFEQAIKQMDDPRFRFHLIVTLLAQDQETEARREWASLDLDKMGPEGLMPDEIETLNQLKEKFGTGNDPNAAL